MIHEHERTDRLPLRRGSSVHAIPAWLLSEGTRRITALFALLESTPPPSLIAVEEIENGLDPWTLQFILRALREAAADGVQILLTTHSPYLLDQVDPDEVIYVSREKGETVYTHADAYEDVKKYMGVVPTGAMYTGGYFTQDQVRGALAAHASTSSRFNGVYTYASVPVVPSLTRLSSEFHMIFMDDPGSL